MSCSPFWWVWTTVGHNLGSETKKAAGIPIFMAIGQCGSVLGSHLYPQTEGPRYMLVVLYLKLDMSWHWSHPAVRDLGVGPSLWGQSQLLTATIVQYSILRPVVFSSVVLHNSIGMSTPQITLRMMWTYLSIICKVSYRSDNRKRDQLYGKPQRNSTVNTHELADKVCFNDIDYFIVNSLTS